MLLRPTRIAVALVSAFLLAVSTAPPAFADRSPGETWVTGTLIDATGTVVAGAPVSLVAWPNGTQLADLALDEEVPTITVGSTSTDAAGQFSFSHSILTDMQLQYLADESLVVDLTVEAEVGGQAYSRSVPRFLSFLVSASGGDPTPPVEIDYSPLDLTPIGPSSVDDPATEPGGAPGQCSYTRSSTLGPRWVTVGTAYTTTNAAMKFYYEQGSTTSIGVGMSVGGSAFKASGTTSITSKSTVGYATVTSAGGKVWRTSFVFAKFKSNCHGFPRVQVRAVSFAAGAATLTAPTAPPTPYCRVFGAGDDFEKTSSTATTFMASTAGDIGINLSATTGYSTQTRVKYAFTVGKRLCGSKDYPGGAPGTLVAKI